MIICQQTRGIISSGADQLALDLPFAETKSLTARIGPTPTFTRASIASFVGSNGLIQYAGNNVPRFQHNPITLDSLGLFGEASRTNLALNSGAVIANVGWGGNLVPSVSGTGPDGNAAYLLREIASNVIQSLANTGSNTGDQGTPVVSGTTYTGSIFLKKVEGSIDWVQLTFGQAGFGQAQYANFNISNGTVGNFLGLASGTSPRVEAFANGWYRCSISVVATTTAATNGLIVASIQNTNGTTRIPTYTGNTANRFLMVLAQFEAGAGATSYIPAGSSAAIRSAEVCNITGSNFSSIFNPLGGTLFANAIFDSRLANPASSSNIVFDINDGTANNRLRFFRGNAGASGVLNTSANNTNVSLTGPFLTAGVPHKLTVRFAADNYECFVNGTSIGLDVSGAMIVSPTTLTIGDSSAGAARIPLNGTISSLKYYRRGLTNPKQQVLTAP